MTRIGLSLLAILTLSACTSTGDVSDRYAFWRDNGPTTDGAKPNLADVPAAPNTQAAQADMEAMKQRLEQDRNNAYLAAQGYPIVDTSSELTQPPVTDSELAPLPPMAGTDMPAPLPAPVPQVAGDVQYNYSNSGETYIYGNSTLQFKQQSMYQQQAQQIVEANPSVSIDFSALDGSAPTTGLSPVGLSGQPFIYFKHGSARLGSGDRAKLRQLASQIKQSPQSVVVIGRASKRTGISDAASARSANLTMSAKRASAVLRELAKQGIDADKVRVTAEGDSAATSSPEAKDRRVDILFD